MPGIVRKLIILAAVDGLILQPATQRSPQTTPSLRISYKSHCISSIGISALKDLPATSLDSHGIVGILAL